MTNDVASRLRDRLARLASGSFFQLAGIYAGLFLAFGTESPFLPSFLRGRSLTDSQIGLVLAAGTLVRLSIGPWIGALADRFGIRLVLAIASAFAGVLGSLYLIGNSFVVLLAISMTHSLSTASLNPLSDALAIGTSRKGDVFTYGSVRAVGSGCFVIGTLASGWLVARFGLSSIIVASSILFASMLPFIPLVSPVAREPDHQTQTIRASLRHLLARKTFRRLLLIASLIIGSQAMSDAFAVISWRSAGLSPTTISALLAEAVTSEILVFLLLGELLLRWAGPAGCFALAAAAGILRWATLASTHAPLALAGTELLQGLTFALTHLTCMRVISQTIPARELGSAQTIYGTLCLGLASALITLASGPLFTWMGAHAFLFMSVLCMIALPLGLSSRWQRYDVA